MSNSQEVRKRNKKKSNDGGEDGNEEATRLKQVVSKSDQIKDTYHKESLSLSDLDLKDLLELIAIFFLLILFFVHFTWPLVPRILQKLGLIEN